jgi:hypothetical protein
MTDNRNDLTTILPCPPWCILPAGHRFHSMTEDGLLIRNHEGPDRSISSVSIGLVADETARTDNGPVVVAEPPTVYVSTDDIVRPCKFTGPELRTIAAALLDAAHEWDQITGATS